MRISWNRGLFRLWIVMSALWVIGSLIWLLSDAADFTRSLVFANCDVWELTSEEWSECRRRYRGPPEGGTWFSDKLISGGGWLVIAVPPVLTLIIGAALMRIVAWIGRGFASISN